MDPNERARASAEAMWADDGASQALGMEIVAVEEGSATLCIKIGQHHCNGHGNCHGGIIFSLADSAFAFACNSRNQRAVAQHAFVSYVSPARKGDILTARAREVSLSGRNGIYDVSVMRQNGDVIAEFRGASRAVSGHLFDE